MKWEFINHVARVNKILDDLERENKERDYPIAWESVHAISCAQIGRLLAHKRGVDQRLSALACSIHDIGRWYTGRQRDHALHGEEPVNRFLENYPLTEAEKKEVIQAVIHHSEKDKQGSPLEELVKDADILDCYLHGESFTKPHHIARLHKVAEELVLNVF